MQNAFYEQAKQELERVRSELEKSPVYKQMRLLESLVDSYAGTKPADKTVDAVDTSRKVAVIDLREATVVPKKYRIEQFAAECIKARGGYASVHDIYKYVIEKGVKVSGKGFSAYLSNAQHLFVADRVRGWSLKNKEENSPQTNTAARTTNPAAVSGASKHVFPQTIQELL